MVTTFTYRPSLVCTQFRVIVLTDTETHPHTHRQDRLQYTAPLSFARTVTGRIDNERQSKTAKRLVTPLFWIELFFRDKVKLAHLI